MKIAIILLTLILFMREVLRMCWAIEHDARPVKIFVPCFFACVIAVLAKFIGNLLTIA